MFKPASLRASLVAAIVGADGARIFERDPDKLRIWADKGRIAGRLGPARGFEYRYRLNVLVIDFSGSEDGLVIAITEWVASHQAELLLNHDAGNQAVTFEVEVLDNNLVDILFELELTETVRLIPRDAGGFDAVHEAEPSTADLLEGEILAGAPARPPLTQVYVGEDLILDTGAG